MNPANRPGITWLFWIALTCLVANIAFAWETDGYIGDGADIGAGFALLTGLIVILAIMVLLIVLVWTVSQAPGQGGHS